jgi:hypothetical protein
MEEISKLLEKYFEAQTSLQDEETLKQYFESDQVKPEHEPYKVLFGVFEAESQISYPIEFQRNEDLGKRKAWNFRLKIISFSGMAAAVLLAVWLFNYHPVPADYAVLNGKRVDNPELAQQLAQKQLNKVNRVLAKSMKPMNSLQKVKQSLEPVRKMSELNAVEGRINN